MRLIYLVITGIILETSHAADDGNESDGDASRKILGSSVVTSVSVVMDTGNQKNTIYTDAVGKPQSKPSNPSELASPIDLLNPDRYEFYTFDDNGDLVKRLMSLEEIKSIIATGDSDALDLDSFSAQGFLPEKRVSDVVNNVQNVLKEEMEILKDPISKPIFDTPDVSDSWSMILPAVFGNSGEDIKPERPVGYVTPDTIMLEPNSQATHSTSGPQKVDEVLSSIATTLRPSVSTSTNRPSSISTSVKPMYYSSPSILSAGSISPTTPTTEHTLNVEIIANSFSTTVNQPPKEASTEVRPSQDSATRVPISLPTIPPLVRNITSLKPTIIQTSTAGTFSSTGSPTATHKIGSLSQSSKPTTTHWATTSFKPTSTKLNGTTTSSSTLKPLATSASNNIFGLPESIEYLTEKHSTSTLISTKLPSSNIFGLPEEKVNPTTLMTSSSSSIPVKTTSTLSTMSTQINIKPQLGITSTVGNVYLNSTATKNPAPEITSPEVSTEKYIDKASTRPYSDIKSSTWAPSSEDTQLFNIFKEVLSQGATENSKLISSSSIPTTEYLDPETTNTYDALFGFESNKTQTTNPNADLNTLPTEFLQQKIPTSSDADLTTNLPTLLNALNDKQKLSASELLDQLLLTTNIYEINTELASPKRNFSDMDERFDNTGVDLSISPQELEQQVTTTDHDIISYPPTTDITLMQSIEQLLSQAVGDVQTVLNETTETTQMLPQGDSIVSSGKGTEIPVSDATTSSTEPELTSATVNDYTQSSDTTTTNDDLNSSLEALLSQVNDHTASLSQIVFTEKPSTDITYRKIDVPKPTSSGNMTTPQPSISFSASSTQTSAANKEEAEGESTTYYYVIKKEPKITTTEGTTPHLINITILTSEENKNRTKPAKADFSLEEEMIAQELNHMALHQNNSEKASFPSNDLLKESEASVILVNSSAPNSNQFGNKLEEIDMVETTVPDIISQDVTAVADLDEVTEQFKTTTSEIEFSTNDSRFEEETTTETITTASENYTEKIELHTSTSEFYNISAITENAKNDPPNTTKHSPIKAPKPSIVITINENRTVVTENGKLVVNKTIVTPSPPEDSLKQSTLKTTSSPSSALKLDKNSTQDQTWTLVSTVAPRHPPADNSPPPAIPYPEVVEKPVPVDLVPKPMQGFGLEESTAKIDVDVHQFVQLCNELAFGFWKTVTTGLSSSRSIFVSPFAATSMLAMVFLGAKGATSEEMNEILKLDDMVTFNPHLTFKSVSESITSEPNSGVATTAMIRELFSDRSKGKLLDFYKNRVRAFYDGFVEEVSYREIGDVIRRRSNLLVKKYTNGKYPQFLKDASITARPPLSGVSINIFETDCSQTSTEGRDGELYFVVLPSLKQRRLVPIPAVVYRSGFLAGYEPSLDATAVALGGKEKTVSTILVIPGQQGIAALGDGLARLEKRLVESSFKKGAWSRLLRSLIPRPGIEVQIPRFSHRSIINATNTLQRMGLHELFNPDSADLRGLNGVANELHLSDVLQINKFATCGEKRGDESYHSEVYPAKTMRSRSSRRLPHMTTLDQEDFRDYQRAFHDPLHDPTLFGLPLSLRPRQARIPEIPRLRFDRPFLYFVRHNPTGLILHMGRFNPRLLP